MTYYLCKISFIWVLQQEKLSKTTKRSIVSSLLLSLAGFVVFTVILFKQRLFEGVAALGAPSEPVGADAHNSIDEIGHYLLSTGDGGYLLPFEAVSVLLLACIVAGLLIARKR